MNKLTHIALSTLTAVGLAGALFITTQVYHSASAVHTVQAATQEQDFKSTVYINYTAGYSIAVFDAPGGKMTGTMLKDGTSWATYKAAKTDDGRTWYNLGGKQWIDAAYAATYRITPKSGTIKIYAAQDVALWTTPATNLPYLKQSIIKLLPAGSSWKVSGQTTVNGITWYNLGGNQWVHAEYTVDPTATQWVFPFGSYNGNYDEGQQFGITTFKRGKDANGNPVYFHDGFDFGSARYSGNFNAIHAGKVIHAAYYDATLLNVIVILSPDGYYTMYQEFGSSANDILVKVNDQVTAGQRIGHLSSDHLHIGITKMEWRAALAHWSKPDGTWLDPIKVIQGK